MSHRYEKVFKDAEISIELRIILDALPMSKKEEAIKVLRPLVSDEAYAAAKARHEHQMYLQFGQDECSCGRPKSVRDGRCWYCKSNDY